jgi:tetratricopeptide (TPR) repeat protein
MSKNTIISVLFATLLFAGINSSAQQVQLLDSAVQYYSNNNFEKAISVYEDILANGYESAELYYNLGNAYYKSNKIPYAILNYERAVKLDSKNEDYLFNLQLANTHVVDKIETLPTFFLTSWWTELLMLLSSNQWALISMGTFVLALLGFLVFFLSQIMWARQLSFWLGVLLLFSSLFAFSFSRKHFLIAQNEPDAIILTPSIVVKSSPSDSGTDLFLIHEGLKVTVTDKMGDWLEIRLSDGNEGWIKETDLVII